MHDAHQANFKRWFDGSKVVDANGKPLVVYHGTAADDDFSAFDPARTGEVADVGFYGPGVYFSDDPQEAARYAKRALWGPGQPDQHEGARIIPVHLALRNPYLTSEEMLTDNELSRIKQKGHDGIISRAAENHVEYVVFRAEQIKSAIGNTGLFRQDNPDITDRVNEAREYLDGLAVKKAMPHA